MRTREWRKRSDARVGRCTGGGRWTDTWPALVRTSDLTPRDDDRSERFLGISGDDYLGYVVPRRNSSPKFGATWLGFRLTDFFEARAFNIQRALDACLVRFDLR